MLLDEPICHDAEPARVRPRPSWRAVAVAGAVGVVALGHAAAAQPDPVEDADTQGRETGVFPLLGGDTDSGFGAGAIGSIAQFDGTSRPYRWQLQFAAFVAFKGGLNPSVEDGFVNLILPQLLDGRLRLELRPSFTRETTLRYYGLGNDVTIPDRSDTSRDFYTRLHPQLQVMTRWRIAGPWSVLGGFQYVYNQVSFDSNSTIAMAAPMIDPKVTRDHSVVRLETGVAYDTRDNEIATNTGMFHTFEIRASPHLGAAFPYKYEQADLQLRFYTTLIPRRMVLAVRAVGDVLLGDVPFYELARYEDTSAIGGSLAVRGLPGYAFYGKVKVFGNIELRTHVTRFSWWDRSFKLGVATFFDAGRLWSDLRFAHPELDGGGLELHWGTGAGIRLQQGRAFVVRADLAWSPDARPIAGYVLADHIF